MKMAKAGFAVLAALPICGAHAAAQAPEKIIHAFIGYFGDGRAPSSLVLGSGGMLYGSTKFGGSSDNGTVFSMTPPASPGGAWTETVLENFPAAAANPLPSVAAVKNGVLLGFTERGGSALAGTVFTLTPPPSPGGQWTETDLYDFTNQAGGTLPNSLIVADGVLYGTTFVSEYGLGFGAVFSLTPPASSGGDWTETVLYSFTGGSDGGSPNSLMMGESGMLYGTALIGGTANNGVAFSLTPPVASGGNWTEKVLYAFEGGGDGGYPMGVAIGSGGVLYGTTFDGGVSIPECDSGCGTVFSLTPPASPGGEWTEAVLYSFNGGSDGYAPPVGVTVGGGGVLYGVTGNGNNNEGGGVAFSLTPPSEPGGAWAETVLHSFTGPYGKAGVDPTSRLVLGLGGLLYGTTFRGGGHGDGTVFELKP